MGLVNKFLILAYSFCLYLAILVALAIWGQFDYENVLALTIIYLVVSLVGLTLILLKIKYKKVSKLVWASLVIIVLFSIIIGIFHHDMPIRRDDLSYINAANRLVDSGSLSYEDALSGPVHGVRQLADSSYTSQFLPAYSVYLAVYDLFGGVNLLFYANILLAIFGLIAMFLIAKTLANNKAGFLAVLFFTCSYIPWWFFKRTNTENLFFVLFWISVLFFVRFVKTKKAYLGLAGLLPASLLTLARPEGFLFLIIYFLALIIVLITKTKRKILNKVVLSVLTIVVAIFSISLFTSYIEIYEAGYIFDQMIDVLEEFDFIFNNVFLVALVALVSLGVIVYALIVRKKYSLQKQLFWLISTVIILFEILIIYLIKSDNLIWTFYKTQYIFENFVYYFLFIYIGIVMYGLLKKKFDSASFWVTFLALPSFLLLLEPNIAQDHPWFMRRFFPVFVPLMTLLAAFVVSKIELSRKQFKIIISGIVIIYVVISGSIIFFQEHRGLYRQLEELNDKLPDQAVILISQDWYWQSVGTMLNYYFDKQALSDFDLYRKEQFEKDLQGLVEKYPAWQVNDNDLLAIMNYKQEKNHDLLKEVVGNNEVYILSTENSSNFHPLFTDDNLEIIDSHEFNFKELKRESDITFYQEQIEILDINEIRKEQDVLPASVFLTQQQKFNILKVVDTNKLFQYVFVLKIPEKKNNSTYYKQVEQIDLDVFRSQLLKII